MYLLRRERKKDTWFTLDVVAGWMFVPCGRRFSGAKRLDYLLD
jgi:hypothetical protein